MQSTISYVCNIFTFATYVCNLLSLKTKQATIKQLKLAACWPERHN